MFPQGKAAPVAGFERCRNSDPNHLPYVESECVLHFMRQAKADKNDRRFETLFPITTEGERRATRPAEPN